MRNDGCNWFGALLAWMVPVLASFVFGGSPASADTVEDSCVVCHSNPDFLVTNKKLFDYFQEWQLSVHQQEEVSCVDCHGGDPGIRDKKGAHGGEVGEANRRSAVNFRNIPETCGQCHEDYLQAYRGSPHFEHLVAKEQEQQGPNCVTCHGSVNESILNVNTVQRTCLRCHNEESENNPDIPDRAKTVLNKFLSIHRFYRYITVRGDPIETRPFFESVGARVESLSVSWHSFDLSKVEEMTEEVLLTLKEKRNELRKLQKAPKGPSASRELSTRPSEDVALD
jgi:hypothetical protein